MQKEANIYYFFFLPGLRAHSHQNTVCCYGHLNLFLIPIVANGWIAPSSTKTWCRMHFHSSTHRTPYRVLHYSTCTFWRCVKVLFTLNGTTTCKMCLMCYHTTNGVNGPQGSFALYLTSTRSHPEIPGRDQIKVPNKSLLLGIIY